MTEDRTERGKVTAYVSHSDCSLHDTGWGHPEHQGRLPGVARAVYRDMLTLFEPLLEVEARPASRRDLLLAHAEEYVERVRSGAADAEASGAPRPFGGRSMISARSWDAALAAVGSALTAVDLVLSSRVRNAFCPVRPPGHQVGRDTPGGFGLLNSVAVAARHLRERRGVERVLVVDCGARAGHGTAEILAADPGSRFVSVHEETAGEPPVWPGLSRTVALPAGTRGAAFREAVRSAVEEATGGFTPGFILLSAGFDALATDPLGGLALQPADYHSLTADLRERAEALCGGRLVSVLEGGFDPAATGQAVVQHLRALIGLPPA